MSALAQKAADESTSAVPSDYRALVCVFLNGGNDGNNTVIPLHNSTSISNFSEYYAARNPYGLALTQNSILPFGVPRMGNLTYGFHPALGVGPYSNGLYELWFSNRWRSSRMSAVLSAHDEGAGVGLRASETVRTVFAFGPGGAVSNCEERSSDLFRMGRDDLPINGRRPTIRERSCR
jgi:hypothetical protein